MSGRGGARGGPEANAAAAARREMLLDVLRDLAAAGTAMPDNLALSNMVAARGAWFAPEPVRRAALVSRDIMNLTLARRLTIEARAVRVSGKRGGWCVRRAILQGHVGGPLMTPWPELAPTDIPSPIAQRGRPRRLVGTPRPWICGMPLREVPRHEALVETHLGRLQRQGMSSAAIARALRLTPAQAADYGLA